MKRLIEKYRLELAISVLLFLYLALYVPTIDETISWCMMPYTLSYKYGFISRGFIGSIVRLVIPKLTLRHIYLIVAFNTLLLCAMTVFFVNRIKKLSGMGENAAFLFTAMLFVVNPGSIAFLFYWGNFGRLDLYMILILLFSALLMLKGAFLFLIPVMCVMGILTHQAFLFMYFPAVMALLLYLAWVKKNRYAKIIFWVTGIVTCITFLYMQFFSSVEGYDYASMVADIYATTDIPEEFVQDDHEMMIRLEYFTSVFATIHAFVIEPLAKNLYKIA